MLTALISIEFDLYCDWSSESPSYRIFFDHELLTERTYIWDNRQHYVRENIKVRAPINRHILKIQSLGTESSRFKVENVEITGIERNDIDIVLA